MAYLGAFGCPRPLRLTRGYQQLFALHSGIDRFSPTKQRPHADPTKPGLSELLFLQRRYKCSDAHDRVFAIMSLLSTEDSQAMEGVLGGGHRMSVREV